MTSSWTNWWRESRPTTIDWLIALQVPEGLKMQALEMMDSIEDESGARVILAADPCYGACDLVHDKMRMMGSNWSRTWDIVR